MVTFQQRIFKQTLIFLCFDQEKCLEKVDNKIFNKKLSMSKQWDSIHGIFLLFKSKTIQFDVCNVCILPCNVHIQGTSFCLILVALQQELGTLTGIVRIFNYALK